MRDILRYVINTERTRNPVNQNHYNYVDSFVVRFLVRIATRLQAEFRSLKYLVLLQSKNRTLHLKDAG